MGHVMDGIHRVAKAWLLGHTRIHAVQFSARPGAGSDIVNYAWNLKNCHLPPFPLPSPPPSPPPPPSLPSPLLPPPPLLSSPILVTSGEETLR